MPLKGDCYVTAGFNACVMRDRGQKRTVLSSCSLVVRCLVEKWRASLQIDTRC